MKAKSSFVIVFLFVFCGARKLPNYVKTCSRNDPHPEECVKKVMMELKPYLIKGIPEMGVPPLDPLVLPELNLETGNGTNFAYKAKFTNLVFVGGKDFEITQGDVDFKNGIFKMGMVIPKYYVNAHYESQGRVVLLDFKSDGPMSTNFTDVNIKGKWVATRIMKKGKEHFRFDDNDVQIDVGRIETRFENLFKGNDQLTDSTNRIFNENSDVLYEEIKPVISGGISQLITSVLNRAHELYSNDELYPDI